MKSIGKPSLIPLKRSVLHPKPQAALIPASWAFNLSETYTGWTVRRGDLSLVSCKYRWAFFFFLTDQKEKKKKNNFSKHKKIKPLNLLVLQDKCWKVKNAGFCKGYEVNINDASPQGSKAEATNKHLLRDFSLSLHITCLSEGHMPACVSHFYLHEGSAWQWRCVHVFLTHSCTTSGLDPGNPVSNVNNPLV